MLSPFLQNPFDEVDGEIVGISGDLFRTFIWCQSVIGNFAKYVMTTCIPSSVLKKLKTKSLNWRYLSAASHDVFEVYKAVGWIAPIASGSKMFRDLLRPVPPKKLDSKIGDEEWMKQFPREENAVFYSERKNCTFATNVPALISILFLWLAERKSLEGYMQVEDAQGRLQFGSDGDLKPISEIPEIDKSLLRLKVSYKGNKRTIAQAIVSLLTNGHGVKGSVDGITFANFLQDCNWTEEMAKEKILKFPTADPSNVARRAFLPNKADKKALEKEAKRDAKKRDGKYKKGNTDDEEEDEEDESHGAGGPRTKKTKKLSAEEVNRDNYYSEQGKFAYKPAELNKILPKEEVSNAGDAIQSIDPTVSMLMERVVRLSLGRAAGLRIETDNPSHEKFSRKFVQDPEENHKKDVKLIANSLSRDLIQITNALCNYSLDMAQAAGKDLSPFDCLQDVRDGNIPMHLAVEKLGQVAFSLCNDISAASELYQSAKRTQDHFFDTSEDNMRDREKKQQQGDFMSRREMNYAKKVTKKISNRANKFEQSEEDKNIFEDEINELQKLAAANMARAEVAASMAHADLAARRAVKLGMEALQEDAVHELVKNGKSKKDESEEQSEHSEDSGDHKLPPVHIAFRPEVAKKSVIEEDDGDDDDSEENEFEFGDDATPDATKPAAVSKMDEATAADDLNEESMSPDVVKKPSAAPNVNDEGSSANDSQPLNQFVKVDSKQQQGKEAKKKLKSQLSKKDKLTKKGGTKRKDRARRAADDTIAVNATAVAAATEGDEPEVSSPFLRSSSKKRRTGSNK